MYSQKTYFIQTNHFGNMDRPVVVVLLGGLKFLYFNTGNTGNLPRTL